MKILFSIFLSLSVGMLSAHEYHISIAEMQYNASSRQFEITISVSTHDLEHSLYESGFGDNRLHHILESTLLSNNLDDYLANGFKLLANGVPLELHRIGQETEPNGLTHFYLVSEPTEQKDVDVIFSLMMENNPDQQNKLILLEGSEKRHFVFLPHLTQQTINSDNQSNENNN